MHWSWLLKRRRWIGIVFLLIYGATYVPFSRAGTYVTNNHGGDHWTRDWCPPHLVYAYRAMSGRTRIAYTDWGMVYLPCILLDRCFWHRGADVSSDHGPLGPSVVSSATAGSGRPTGPPSKCKSPDTRWSPGMFSSHLHHKVRPEMFISLIRIPARIADNSRSSDPVGLAIDSLCLLLIDLGTNLSDLL